MFVIRGLKFMPAQLLDPRRYAHGGHQPDGIGTFQVLDGHLLGLAAPPLGSGVLEERSLGGAWQNPGACRGAQLLSLE